MLLRFDTSIVPGSKPTFRLDPSRDCNERNHKDDIL